jgi:4-hydroxybenzoate-CoA ligase
VPGEIIKRRPYNAAADLIDTKVNRGLGSQIAFTGHTRTLTYRQLQARSVQFARALGKLGLAPESRIALVMHDNVDFPVVFLGAIRAGIIAVPLNTLLGAEHYEHLLADSRAVMVVVSASLAGRIAPLIERLPRLRHLVIVDDIDEVPEIDGIEVHHLLDLEAGQDTAPFAAATISDEVAFWVYTSGSTGRPKGVKHVHSSLMATAKLMGSGVLGLNQDDLVFSASKLFFAFGLGNSLSLPLYAGAGSLVMPDRPTPDFVLATMARYQPTVFCGIPSLYANLIAHPDLTKGAGSDRLRLCISAGEPLPAELGERWRDVVGVDILDGLGSTEMLQTFLSNRPDDNRYGTTGKPVPGYECKIVDDNGSSLGADEIGELVVRGPSAGDGYWNQRTKSRRTFVGEWTYTGDQYSRDADGYYRYCGRTDDMLKVSGMWVSPFDIESALMSHEAVLEAAVIGKPDDVGLIKPKAFVVLRNGVRANDALFKTLQDHVKTTAGPWKYPRWIEHREKLPRTATGKIQRFVLRDEEIGSEPPATL